MILNDSNSIYKSLIKINQIGKKLAPHSHYILSNGCLLSHTKQEMADIIANPITIAFIDNKLLKGIDGLGNNIGILIDGDNLYKYSQEYEFENIEILENGININFIYYSVNSSTYDDDFKKILKDKGFSDDDISLAAVNNYTSNMDIYDLYLKYKKTYEPKKEKTLISLFCEYAKTNNFMYKKCEYAIDLLNNSNLLYDDDIIQEVLDIITDAKQPKVKTFNLNNGKEIKIRLMKSIFNPISAKSIAGIMILQYKNIYILVSRIIVSGITVFNIFRILDF